MAKVSTGRKIWNVIYPVLVMFALYFGVIYGGLLMFSSGSCTSVESVDSQMESAFPLITVIALVVILIVEYFIYKKDCVVQSRTLFQKPVWIIAVIVLGMAASHGLNLLISLLPESLLQGYQDVQNEIFSAQTVFVIIRAVILAPLAEELVFRGLVYRRMKEYTNFWAAALVSAALFGIYHMNLTQGIYAFIFGILLAFVYQRFQNLWAPILIHFAANLLSVILTYTGADYASNIVYILAIILMLALSSAIIVLIVRKVPVDTNF